MSNIIIQWWLFGVRSHGGIHSPWWPCRGASRHLEGKATETLEMWRLGYAGADVLASVLT